MYCRSRVPRSQRQPSCSSLSILVLSTALALACGDGCIHGQALPEAPESTAASASPSGPGGSDCAGVPRRSRLPLSYGESGGPLKIGPGDDNWPALLNGWRDLLQQIWAHALSPGSLGIRPRLGRHGTAGSATPTTSGR